VLDIVGHHHRGGGEEVNPKISIGEGSKSTLRGDNGRSGTIVVQFVQAP
jgi:hypothetical protein